MTADASRTIDISDTKPSRTVDSDTLSITVHVLVYARYAAASDELTFEDNVVVLIS